MLPGPHLWAQDKARTGATLTTTARKKNAGHADRGVTVNTEQGMGGRPPRSLSSARPSQEQLRASKRRQWHLAVDYRRAGNHIPSYSAIASCLVNRVLNFKRWCVVS